MPLANLFTRKKKPLSSRLPNSTPFNQPDTQINPMTRTNVKPKFDALFAANRAASISKLEMAVRPIQNLFKAPDGPETVELYFDRERSPSRNILRKFSDEDLNSLKRFAQGRTLYNNTAGGGRRKSRRATRRHNRK
jgi:hypothetical protein